MRRNTVGAIWLGGLLLTAAIYLGGAEQVLRAAVDAVSSLQITISTILAHLSLRFGALLRALAIALYVVFVALGVVAVQRGVQAKRALLFVTLLMLVLLVGPVWMGDSVSAGRWTLAFSVSCVAALVMTQRLRDRRVEDPRWSAR